ncbi:MAG TPA: hypothetical protein VHH09_09065 [Acidimicrobiales bacterium]|nr:hypothetical protein [Acidimicrobiales bacterium]
MFACSLDWPGWCRSGKTDEAALEALAAYAPRYAPVVAEAGTRFPKGAAGSLEVVERLPGSASTDFGVPGEAAEADLQPLTKARADRLAAILRASWTVFDRVVAGAPPSLRKGPRGGGRDRDAVVEHVLGAEVGYARKLGLRHHQPAAGDRAAVEAVRASIEAAIRHARRPVPPEPPKAWPYRYAARRLTWHVLDHAWEIEDRSEPLDDGG